MSSKRHIEHLVDIVAGESHILSRDFLELERLQSAGIDVVERFAIASYRKFTERIVSKITNFVPAYTIVLPAQISCSYKGLSQIIDTDKILSKAEHIGHGNELIGSFMISPLDGLINFSRSIPSFCVSIVVLSNKDDTVTVNQALVYDVMRHKFYTATIGFGAFLDSSKIVSSNRSKIAVSSIAICGLETLIREEANAKETASIASKIKNISISCANYISGLPSQLALCYLASGKLDMVIEASLKDRASFMAGATIAREAGCAFFDQYGKPIEIESMIDYASRIVIIANKSLSAEIIKVFGQQ